MDTKHHGTGYFCRCSYLLPGWVGDLRNQGTEESRNSCDSAVEARDNKHDPKLRSLSRWVNREDPETAPSLLIQAGCHSMCEYLDYVYYIYMYSIFNMYVYLYLSLYIYTYVYVCVYTHTCWYECMYVCMYVCMHVCMYVMYVMYVCMYLCMYVGR